MLRALLSIFRKPATTASAAAASSPLPPVPAPVQPRPRARGMVVLPVSSAIRSSLPPGGVELLDEKLRRTLDAVPPLPQLAIQLLREIARPESSAASIAKLATQDTSLAAALLRAANSSAYSPIRPITSIQESVAKLGHSAVRSLMMRMRLDAMLGSHSGGDVADEAFEELWTHGLAVAMIAEALAIRFGADRTFCSTLGLLHDLGKLLVLRTRPEAAQRLRETSPSSDESALGRERRVLGADHADIGAHVASRWSLPGDLVEGIRFHHAPHLIQGFGDASDDLRRDVAVVCVANQLAKVLHLYSDDAQIDIIGPEIAALLGEAELDLESLAGHAVRKAASDALLAGSLALGRPTVLSGRLLRLTGEADVPLRIAEAEHAHQTDAGSSRFRCVPDNAADFFAAAMADSGITLALPSSVRIEEIPAQLEELLASLGHSREENRRTVFTLRWIVAAARRQDPKAVVHVGVRREIGRLTTCVRCDALSFDQRFGAGVAPHLAARILDRECAGMVNLDWFQDVSCSSDGATLRLAA